ncbi:MAG: tRNA (adenosine(37)-N6)-threonylcarbamoyltransferase complex ATPase subunit type 1 TsaE [Treponema sp.]|jgi:tRNA threonylcarbamoyladenosine biosynthesis protein TsaE|nr:tRNA (adenosine(37)-N6)-threonylcarbamoyltransferase complex ATPase subunit type 1 TsaE [Treponema sp.]
MTWIPPEASQTEFFSGSPEDTEALGERLASGLPPGSVLALRGPLGAGKTCFAKGLARGLGVEEAVTSPTYTIVSEYEARALPFYHIDAYRLGGEDDFEALGGRELLYGRGICLIEWSERIEAALPPRTIRVKIEITGENSRTISVSGGPL